MARAARFRPARLLRGKQTLALVLSGAADTSDPDGVERTPLLETHILTTPDRAAVAPDPPPCLETEASQVMAETGEGCFEAVALPPPQLPEVEGAPPAGPPDPGCAGTFQIRDCGDGGYVAPEARLEPAPPPREGLETASVFLATDDSLGNGRQSVEPQGSSREKALETCGAEKLGSDLISEAKAEGAKTEEGPVFSVAVDEEVVGKERAKEEEGVEQGMEVEERPVGEEIEMVENRVVEEVE